MDKLSILLYATIFLFVFLMVLCGYWVWNGSKLVENRKLKKRLLTISAGGKHGQEKLNLYRKKVFDRAGPLESLLLSLPRLTSLDRMLLRSGARINASSFLLLSCTLGCGGLLFGGLLHSLLAGVAVGGLMLTIPLLWLRVAEQKSLARFQEQLPEALDLLGRALRSGHALSSGLEMMAEEMPDPLGGEFRAVVDEVSLGLTLKEALENLCERVKNQDLRFFTISILVQRETGGNIAEILDNISRLIRERGQFKRQVATLTAEGKVSAAILMLLPVIMFAIIYVVNYNYISTLWIEPEGRMVLAGAVGLQALGGLLIRRIIRIEM